MSSSVNNHWQKKKKIEMHQFFYTHSVYEEIKETTDTPHILQFDGNVSEKWREINEKYDKVKFTNLKLSRQE